MEEEDFLEEEYAADTQDPELAEEGAADPSQWWGSVNDLCSQAYQDDDDGGRYVEEDVVCQFLFLLLLNFVGLSV